MSRVAGPTLVQDELRTKVPTSWRWWQRACASLPGGVTHALRQWGRLPIFVDHAQGSRKWDVDGNEYIDYQMGHGALLMGHSHPLLVDAVRNQVERGTHYGADHPDEVLWAELVKQMVPSVDSVRFVSSGTEAVMLAVRLARAYTRRHRVIKFKRHFHGWSDDMLCSADSSGRYPGDLPQGLGPLTIDLEPDLPDLLEGWLREGDVAAVIIEPTGAHFGQVELRPGFVAEIRALTERFATLLILDEVVTGFRTSVGGAQEVLGIRPDLSTFAKILGGGLPAGAVGGRREIMDQLDNEYSGGQPLYHPGTFNANPMSAAAGISMLTEVAAGYPVEQAISAGSDLRRQLRLALDAEVEGGRIWGDASIFHLSVGRPQADAALNTYLLLEGVHLLRNSGLVSSVHSVRDLDLTVAAVQAALRRMRRDGLI